MFLKLCLVKFRKNIKTERFTCVNRFNTETYYKSHLYFLNLGFLLYATQKHEELFYKQNAKKKPVS